MKRDFKNILVVRTDRLGDVVLTTPALKALRDAFPKARISFLAASDTKEIIDQNPYLDEILVDDRKEKNKGMMGFIRLVLLLRSRKYDLAVIFHTKRRTNLLCFLAGIPHRVGYKNNKWGGLLSDPLHDTRHLGIKHESEYCLDVLRHLGLNPGPREFHVSISQSADEWVKNLFKDHHISANDRVVLIHPGASDPSRRWPEHHFAELINYINSQYPSKVILVGTKEMRTTIQIILSKVEQPIIDLTGKTTMGQLVGLIGQCNLLVSNDSGPVHVASGLDVPVISIFTRNQKGINPERWGPLGVKARVVSVPFNESISFAKAGQVDPNYMELIKTEEVLRAVDSIFKLC